jgi:hypothetical protein
MREILVWGDPSKEFQRIGVNPERSYSFYGWSTDDDMYVYHLTDEEFEKLNHDSDIYEMKNQYCTKEDAITYKTEIEAYPDNAWDECAWQYAIGSNMGGVYKRYKINNHYVIAWDGTRREYGRNNDYREYDHLLQYFCDEIGASTEKNVCALAIDLARQNGMTMAELFKKYQG